MLKRPPIPLLLAAFGLIVLPPVLLESDPLAMTKPATPPPRPLGTAR